ncbi:Signal transduction histidine kinase [Streptomyces sp. 2224.1]|nr:Signal transduction histidine kinase [Streptomyces sp. 2112.3]SEE20428.1 Signal transduction histidine kinase [Streptomyces sp. 2224.1]
MACVRSDPDSARRPSSVRAHGVQQWWASTVRPLRGELLDLSPRPLPTLHRARNRAVRQLPLVLAGLFTLYLVVPGADVVAERLQMPWPVPVLLACLQAASVPLSLARPVAAWWLSLVAMVPFPLLLVALGAPPARDTPWPWTEPGFLAHLAVTLIVAWRVSARLFVTQWLLTLLVGGALAVVLRPAGAGQGLYAFGILSGVGLLLLAAVRGRREAQRQLRRQEKLTEIERFRRTLLEERARIARELHDVVAHHMSVVAVQAEAAPYLVADPPEAMRESFGSIRRNALAALTELRHVLGMMRSDDPGARGEDGKYVPQPTLDDLGELVGNVRAAGLTVETDIAGTPRALPPHVELSAFRITQEALSNVLRHAPGAQVRVELTYGEAELGVQVTNSPVAATARRQSGNGHGVLGMRERASMLGGTLHVGRMRDGWFEVRAVLPTGRSEDS